MHSFLLASSLAATATAFPLLAEMAGNAGQLDERQLPGVTPGFSAEAQRIDVSGAHAFVAPDFAAGDLRGPCPGLNALSNHNYLPHNGVATQLQYVEATNKVYGMGVDVGEFLALYGAVLDGDGVSWSIGGAPPKSLTSIAPGLLGYPQGLIGSHNKYETDSSPTRGDLYQYGNNYKLQMSQFKELYDMQKDEPNPNYNLDVIGDFRMKRLDESIANSPDFFYGPFTGIVVSQAAYAFIYRFMGNKSEEHPEGVLNKEVLKSFFAVSGDDDNLVHTPGHERIPENWYKRAIGDEYTIPYFSVDNSEWILKHPRIATVGGNTGKKDSFTGVNIADLTGGVYNLQTLTQGNNLMCFAFQASRQAVPDVGLAALGALTSFVDKTLLSLGCPKLEKLDESQFDQFPGAKVGGVSN